MPIRERVELKAEEEVSREFKKAGGAVDSFGDKLTKFAKGAGIGLAIGAAARFGGALVGMAIDAGEAESAFNTTFGEALPRASRFVDEFANKAGFATYELQQMLAVTGNVVQGIGATEEESAALSESMAVLAGDVASFSNAQGGAEAVLMALQSAINGEREALKTYGLAIAETEVQERALLETGKEHADELTRLEKAQATVNIAYEKAGKAVGDLDRTQESAANTIRRLQARLKEAGVEAGERLLPALEDVLPVIEDMIPALTDAGVAIADAFATFGPAIGTAIGWFDDLVFGWERAATFLTEGATDVAGVLAEVFTLGFADTSGLFGASDAAQRAGRLAEVNRELAQGMVPGANAATQLANALADVGRIGGITEDSINRLSRTSGATAEEQLSAINTLRQYADEQNWTKEQTLALTNAQIDLKQELGLMGGEVDASDRKFQNMAESMGAAGAEAGPTAEEVSELAKALQDELVPGAEEAAAAFRDELAEEAGSFITGFEELPERVETTMDEFEENLTDRVTAQSEFWNNLAILAESGFGHLAESIREQGPTAAGLLEELVGDMERAAELDDMIEEAGTQMGDVTDRYATALEEHGDPTLSALGQFGLDMIDAINAGIESGDISGTLGAKIARDVAAVTGNTQLAAQTAPTAPSRPGGATGPRGPWQKGTWSVPGGPSDAVLGVVHGTEIIIPPEGSGGRAEFARQIAAEMAGVMGDRDGGGPRVNIEQILVSVPAGSTVTETALASATVSAIEELLS